MKTLKVLQLATLLLSTSVVFAVSGCATASKDNGNLASTNAAAPTPSRTNSASQNYVRQGNILIVGASGLAGKSNLTKWELHAKDNPHSADAQITAAMSAHVNGNNHLAIGYYEKALKLSPADGLALTSIGNIYAESLNEPNTALKYYQQSTQKDPGYGWGWYQLARIQQQQGQASLARSTAQSGLRHVKSSDPAYAAIKQFTTG